ncbi:hypothetical protein DFH11DRAFT_1730360 [Phellopilus nigrolimitatus]|nr:hypothetical protein DFH11DRAFT_1730360 [Phellopilus nigrolimitatus]
MENLSTFFTDSLPEALVEELKQLLTGKVFTRKDAEFQPRTSIFNGNVKTPSKAVVLPVSADDISLVLKFCIKHGLFPSIKAGGYGTAGWSINGDIVVDLSELSGIDIETPSPDGGSTSLRDLPPPGAKGKGRIGGLVNTPALNLETPSAPFANPGKRRRSPEAALETVLPRNPLVDNFLRFGDLPSPNVRRRLDNSLDSSTNRQTPADAENMSRQSSSSSDSATITSPGDTTSPSTAVTSPSLVDGEDDSKLDDARSPAGLYDRRSTVESLIFPELSAPAPEPAVPPPSFSVRSEDPFGYLSAAPSPASSRPQRGYEQPIYQPSASSSSVSANSSARSPMPSSGRVAFNEISVGAQNPFMVDGAPGSTFLSSTATPLHRNAFVTFGAGVKQKDIDLFTAAHPLPATSANGIQSSIAYHVPMAAHPVGSSVMILGGFGFLSRLYGLSIDAVVEVEMVLADGSIIFVNEKEHPDLWWSLRGGGPAFGVVTRYKAIAYPVPIVFAGNLIYNFHAATAASLIKHFRDCVKSAPRELYANVLLTAGPADKGSLVVVQLCYIGAQEKGKEFLQAIESWDGEPCLLNEVSEKSFLSQQDSVAQILRGKRGRQWFIRSALITSLPDEVIHKTVNEFADTPVGCTWLFELAGGAVADAEDTCLPKSQREAGFTIAAFHQWELDDDDPLCVTTAEHWIYETLAPVSTGGPYPAFLGRHERADRVMACYGENWSRLCEIKRKYDPRGLFKNTYWPLDIDGNAIESHAHEPPSP